MPIIDAFMRDIDRHWVSTTERKLPLRVIGSAALMLRARYERGTKDSDILETTELTPETSQRLLAIAGSGTALHARHRLYLDIVPNGIPFLPQVPLWHPLVELNASLAHFDLLALDVVDVVVSKLKRFSANDQTDIEAMIDRALVSHADLVARFRAAVDFNSWDANVDLERCVANLHRVERDMLDLPETEIDLPGWV